MDKNNSNTLLRTEEVQHIIERIPTNFGIIVTGVVLFISVALLFFGWIIKYPDIVKGRITVNSTVSPLKLISNTSGKLRLNSVKSLQYVKEGQIIGYIENPANPGNVHFVDSLMQNFSIDNDKILNLHLNLPRNYSMGELNIKYYEFINNLQVYIDNKENTPIFKQCESLKQILKQQEKARSSAMERLKMNITSLTFAHKFYRRDSMLFLRKIISESELDKSEMTYNTSKDNYQGLLNNSINVTQQIQETKGKIQELLIQEPDKDKQLTMALISTYNDLRDNIKIWEQKYVFKAPFNGRVQFLKFWTNDQFVQSGEQIFTMIPKAEKIIGQAILPLNGAGKVRAGQEVIVKFDDYPYVEYGSVKGKVKSISLTTSTIKTAEGDMDNYMVLVDFPNNIRTNYGMKLNLKAELKGTAEIIADDRKLIQRLFDNLKYITR